MEIFFIAIPPKISGADKPHLKVFFLNPAIQGCCLLRLRCGYYSILLHRKKVG